jgi:hypothetical protein
MKRLLLATLLFVSFPLCGAGDEVKKSTAAFSPQDCSPPADAVKLYKVGNVPFKPGERLEFVLKYQFVAGGSATMEVHEGPEVHCRRTYQFISNARSNNVIDNVFKVRDVNSSVVDAQSLSTLQFHQNLREGHYKVVRNTTIDYYNRVYKFERDYKGRKTYREGAIDEPVNDILSAFFRARTLPLIPGKSYEVRVFSDPNIYPLKIDVDPKVQKIRVPAGSFECIKITPQVVGDAIFKAKDGRMSIWLTNDERKMPVLIRSKVAVGSFDAELTSY